jgi:hypothetical protein
LPPAEPQAETAIALAATVTIVLMGILDRLSSPLSPCA